MNNRLDISYTSKLGSVSASDYGKTIVERRSKAAEYFALLPPSLTTLPDVQLDELGPSIKTTLLEIEKLQDSWVHRLADDELLGQEFEEETAEIWACSRATGAFLNMMIRRLSAISCWFWVLGSGVKIPLY